MQQAAPEIPRAFESESYQRRRAEVVEPFEREREELLEQVRSFARSRGLDLEITPAGVISIPLVHGQAGHAAGVRAAARADPARARARRAIRSRSGWPAVFPQLREIESRVRERVRALDREVVLFAVGHLIDDIKQEHAGVRRRDRAGWSVSART